MKKQLLHLIIVVGLFALLPLLVTAQSNERMLIYSKSGDVFPYRIEHIDSVKFLTGTLDLSLNPTVSPHSDGTTGKMKLKIGAVGSDVHRIKVVIPESFVIAKMSDMQCIRLFNPDLASRIGVQIFEVEPDKEYDLSGLQQGYTYTAVFLPYDEINCPGNIKRVEFTVPKGKLAGDPKIEVTFSNVTQTGYTATLKPNEDVAGYFFLNDETNNPSREEMMKMFGLPDLKHYIVRFGADFATGKAHTGVMESKMDGFKPGVEYTVFVVLVDKDGQYSDLYTTFTVTTQQKGTSETAHVSIEVKDITESEATVVYTPDANTSSYRETIVEKSLFNEADMIKYLQDTPDNMSLPYHSGAYTWTWSKLKAGTAYYAVAMGKNADGKWGPLSKIEFTTIPIAQPIKLPLEYVAEYNVNSDGTDFATTHATDVSGYFTFKDAVSKFSDITIAGKKYHLPSKEEWMSIAPPSRSTPDYIDFGSSYTYTDVTESVSVGGETITSKNDYYGAEEDVVYALRFKGTDLCSAWKYEYTYENSHRVLRVTARPVGNATTPITIDDVRTPEFWGSNTSEDIIRILPASGWFGTSNMLYAQNSLGCFWSATSYDQNRSWYMVFGKANSRVDYHFGVYHYSVRLFETVSR